jgi:hypothetical protein
MLINIERYEKICGEPEVALMEMAMNIKHFL